MSRSNNQELISPAKKFLAWDGAKGGGFIFFDKSKGEGEKVKLPLPLKFLTLDTVSMIRGFSKAENAGFWSNQVKDIKKDILKVRLGKKVFAVGTYDAVKEKVKAAGGKYCQAVYIASKDGKGLAINCLELTGTALSAWVDFRNKNKVFDGAVHVTKDIEGKNGATVFRTPVFEKVASTPQADEAAKALDVELQAYLVDRFKLDKAGIAENGAVEAAIEVKPEEALPDMPTEPVMATEEASDDLPF